MTKEFKQESEFYLGRQAHLFDGSKESTDLALMVDALAQEKRTPWDTGTIRDALIIEVGVDPATAAFRKRGNNDVQKLRHQTYIPAVNTA